MSNGHKERDRRLVHQALGLVAVIAVMAFAHWYAERPLKPKTQYLRGWLYWMLDYEDQMTPPQTFKVDRADKRACAAEEFGFALSTELGFALDSFKGTLTKDMISRPDTMISFRLDKKTMEELRDLYLSARLADLPEPAPPYGSEQWYNPEHVLGVVRLEIRCGGTAKSFVWHSGHTVGSQYKEEWRRLWWFAETAMIAAMYSPEYRALPKASGGYL